MNEIIIYKKYSMKILPLELKNRLKKKLFFQLFLNVAQLRFIPCKTSRFKLNFKSQHFSEKISDP